MNAAGEWSEVTEAMAVPSDVLRAVRRTVDKWRDRVVDLSRVLISIPSLSGQEGDVAKALSRAMDELGYDEVRVDEVGNVIGTVHGVSRSPGVVLNGHMDTVPPADMDKPFRPEVVEGSVFGGRGLAITGRGACDMKGPLAAMVLAGAVFKEIGMRPARDFVVSAVVLEEVGGSIGSSHLIRSGIRGKLAIIGEPTSLRVNLGHRGSVHMDITTFGKAAHASTPEVGENAIYLMAPVIEAIEHLNHRLPEHPFLGKATVAACDIDAFPGVRNVVPSACRLSVNFRTVPKMDEAAVISLLKETLGRVFAEQSDRWKVDMAFNEGSTYTGRPFRTPKVMRGYWCEPSGAGFAALASAVQAATGRDAEVGFWRFSTDGPCFFLDGGMPAYGFGPGDETVAHSSTEHVLVGDLLAACVTYALLGILVT